MKSLSAKPDRQDQEVPGSLRENGGSKPVIDRWYPLDKAADAMNYLGQGHVKGNVMIRVGST